MVNSVKIDINYNLIKLKDLIEEIELQVGNRVNEGKLLGNKDDIDFLVPALFKSISYLKQIIILCENGYPDGALILARNIYEQVIICLYIENQETKDKHDKFLDRYFQDSELTRLKLLLEASKRFNQESDIVEYKKQINEHKEKYGSYHKQFWWADVKNFKELSDFITNRNDSFHGLTNNMYLEYKMASLLIHSSSFSNRMNIGANHCVDTRTRCNGHENALFLAVSSIIPIVGFTYMFLDLKGEKIIKELNDFGYDYLDKIYKMKNYF